MILGPDGHVISIDRDGNQHTQDTRQCVHCGGHFVVIPGSGRRRGFCTNCMGPTCGAAACAACEHWKAKIDRALRAS